MDIKKVKPTKLLWIDLEMTGLDVAKDKIIEVAAIVTDFEYKTLATYQSYVRQPDRLIHDRMNTGNFWPNYPVNRDEFYKQLPTAPTSGAVESELMSFVIEHFKDEPAILAGNSIHNDRKFMDRAWPRLNVSLHYRMLDVSSLKIIMQGQNRGVYAKKDVHRAMADIKASIAGRQYYLKKLQKKNEHEPQTARRLSAGKTWRMARFSIW